MPFDEFFKIDVDAVYDEFGDEFDCRLKTVHSQGNVGKAEWRDLGGHEYTGIFKGADTGFVRLSTSRSVLKPEDKDSDEQSVMNPTIALKFLRDQTLSANAVANHNIAGQTSYNFFENSLHSNLGESTENVIENLNQNVARTMWSSSQFVASTGISDMALYDQCGAEVYDPVFPYSLRYEPNQDLSY